MKGNWQLKVNRLQSKKKGNINILVIFILLASGVIGIMTMHFVRQLLYYTGAVDSYYKSYYLARAGLELSLTQIQNRWVGFEYWINTWDQIVEENFICRPNCSITTEIISLSAHHNKNSRYQSGCTEENAFVLSGWESLVIPLFIDNYSWINNSLSIFNKVKYKSRFPVWMKVNYNKISPQTEDFTLAFLSEDMQYTTISQSYKVDNTQAFKTFLEHKYITPRRQMTGNYLIVSNGNKKWVLNFCLDFADMWGRDRKLPLTQSHIKSIWSYHNKTLGLEALYNHNILPSFLSHTSLGY